LKLQTWACASTKTQAAYNSLHTCCVTQQLDRDCWESGKAMFRNSLVALEPLPEFKMASSAGEGPFRGRCGQ